MSGETESQVSGWTTDTLHSHLVKLLEERSIEWNARFEAQERAIQLAREAELMLQKGVGDVLRTRMDAMDKAVVLFQENLTRVPTDVNEQVGHLKSLHDERFRSLDTQLHGLQESMVVRFEERDTRSEREARDNKIAVDAAFAAAKEAVVENNKSSALATDKSEASFTKQIDSLGGAVNSKFEATDGQVDDLKTAVGALTTQVSTLAQGMASNGIHRAEDRIQQNWSTGMAVSAVLGIAGLLVSIVVAVVVIVHG